MHEKAGRSDLAIASYRRAAELDEAAFAPRNNLAVLLAAGGDLDGALAAAQEAFAIADDNPYVMDTLGELYLRSMTRFTLVQLFYMQGIGDRAAVNKDEIGAYYDLLKRGDGGTAFLKIMRGFELTQEKQDFLWRGLGDRSYPADVVINDRWGKGIRHKHGGYYTTEYGAGLAGSTHPWEENRGMGHSFGYSRAEQLSDYKSTRELILMLIDLVSRGGNLLLDIGPTGDCGGR